MKYIYIFLSLFLVACSDNSKRATYLYNKGVIALNQGLYENALKYFNQSIELDPTQSDVYTNRGYLHDILGNINAAMSDYRNACMKDPFNAIPVNNIAVFFAESNQMDSAAFYYRKAIALDSTYIFSYHGLAHVLADTGNAKEAIKYFKLFKKFTPNFRKRLIGEGLSSQAETLDHEYLLSDFYIGIAYKKIGAIDSAKYYLKKAYNSGLSEALDSLRNIQ